MGRDSQGATGKTGRSTSRVHDESGRIAEEGRKRGRYRYSTYSGGR